MGKRFTWQECPGSGQPPYRYVPGKTEYKLNHETRRITFAEAVCEVCGKQKKVNTTGKLRTHLRKVDL